MRDVKFIHADGTTTILNVSEKNFRKGRGKSLISFPDMYCVVDLETTGFDPNYDEIIEISAIKVVNNNVVDKFSSLTKLEHTDSISEYITKLTGITNDMIKDAPNLENVLTDFLNFVGNNIIVGHNINFDIRFLYDNCFYYFKKPFTNDYIDTMRISRKLLPDLNNHKLKTISKHYNIDYSNAHRGLTDCNITYNCFNSLKDEVLTQYNSIEEFTKIFKPLSAYNSFKNITTDKTDFDITHPLYNKVCVFTGKLDKMTRKDALQLVADFGGICGNSVTSKTNYLIMGDTDYSKNVKDGMTAKFKKAMDLKLKGQDIDIITENVFFDLIENN